MFFGPVTNLNEKLSAAEVTHSSEVTSISNAFSATPRMGMLNPRRGWISRSCAAARAASRSFFESKALTNRYSVNEVSLPDTCLKRCAKTVKFDRTTCVKRNVLSLVQDESHPPYADCVELCPTHARTNAHAASRTELRGSIGSNSAWTCKHFASSRPDVRSVFTRLVIGPRRQQRHRRSRAVAELLRYTALDEGAGRGGQGAPC